ncbi:L-aspartate oxidase [Polyangium jinanense]|uniref:L-aspartate oxidase n=1 Tax=Polyangium jinanense TaxID=2829994 RepID=A0A9X4AQV9_9BACT|nr:L-aspartate oxidase [Polyangium jinanense]MDC3979432.1 L-aspartate oxidase [Polyangium jinanense]
MTALSLCVKEPATLPPVAVTTDFLVIGSGIAGLTFALDIAEHGEVVVVTKRSSEESNTRWAQGGIAAVISPEDTFDAHIKDTLVAGAGLCHEVVVDICVREGPDRIRELMDRGARFDREKDGSIALAREGGHSARRVLHVADATGFEVERALLDRCRAHPNIRILEHHMAIDLIVMSRFGGPDVCVGAYVLNTATRSDGEDDAKSHLVETYLARATILASGGAGKVYLYTSNPDVATGDGIAMAYRAGAEIANMEFYQFHPTCLYHPQAKSFLITEALRGEGAILRLPDGTPFMANHDPRKELAPRDIVARAIDFEMKRTGSEFVLLDITHRPASFVCDHFPTIYAECLRFGIDITSQPIPVVPAAHYLCGGISTDLHGRTTIPGLWAVGECACTGLHGANRLASNSLLEGLVFGHRAAVRLASTIGELGESPFPEVPEWQIGDAVPSDEEVVVTHNWDELRRTMWNYVGIVRSNARLRRAARRIALLQDEIREYYWRHLVTRDLLELRNIATVAELIVGCAAARHESRGLHATIDYPQTNEKFAADTVVKRGVVPHLRGR